MPSHEPISVSGIAWHPLPEEVGDLLDGVALIDPLEGSGGDGTPELSVGLCFSCQHAVQTAGLPRITYLRADRSGPRPAPAGRCVFRTRSRTVYSLGGRNLALLPSSGRGGRGTIMAGAGRSDPEGHLTRPPSPGSRRADGAIVQAKAGDAAACWCDRPAVVSDRSRFISRNDVTLRGARGDCAQGRSGRSRPWPRIRAKQALGPTGPVPLSGGTWREVETSLRPHFPLVPISPSPAGCARPGEHASGQPDRRPAAGSLGAPRPVAWAARLSRVAWPAEALPSGCPGHPLRRRGDGRTGRTTRVAGNPVPAGRPVSIKIYAKTRDNRRRPCRCAGVTTGSPVWRGDQGRGIGGEERPSRHRRPRRRAGPLDGASVDA